MENRSYLRGDFLGRENRTLRRLIRNIKTGQFFQAGTWTADASAAQDFPDTRELLILCAQHQLKDVELVVQAGHDPLGTFDIHVPLPELGGAFSVSAPQPAAG